MGKEHDFWVEEGKKLFEKKKPGVAITGPIQFLRFAIPIKNKAIFEGVDWNETAPNREKGATDLNVLDDKFVIKMCSFHTPLAKKFAGKIPP